MMYHYSIRTNVGIHTGETTLNDLHTVIGLVTEEDFIACGMETNIDVESIILFSKRDKYTDMKESVGSAVYSYYEAGILTWEDLERIRGDK